MHDGDQIEQQAKTVGGQGFVRKDQAAAQLLKAVDTLSQNKTFFHETKGAA
jgi:hypothetical protein